LSPLILQVRGRNLDVTDALRAHAEKRLGRLDGILPGDTRLELELMVEPNPSVTDGHVAEATAWTAGPVLRARAGSSDIYASIDLAADRLERRVRRYRERKQRGRPHHATPPLPGVVAQLEPDVEPDAEIVEDAAIVKTKRFALKPMLPEEAVLQLELVDHAFFVFEHAETGEVNVVYRRRDGRFGLIEPER
jgi:putative sigma-54 modulation protein